MLDFLHMKIVDCQNCGKQIANQTVDITNQSKTVGTFFVLSNVVMAFKKRAKSFLAPGVLKISQKHLPK